MRVWKIVLSLAALGTGSLLLAGCTLLYPNVPNWNNTPTPPGGEAVVATATSDASLQPDAQPEGSLRSSEINLVRFAMFNGQYGWGIGENAVLHTDTAAAFWYPVTPDGLDVVGRSASSFFLDQATGWVLIPDAQDFSLGTLYRSTDSGNSWQSSSVPFSQATFSFIDQQFGWAMFSSGAAAGSSIAEIFQTTDGGQTWRQVYVVDPDRSQEEGNIPFSGSKTGITFLNMERGWVTGEIPADGFIYVYLSADGGLTWSQQDLKLPAGMENSLASFKPPIFFDARNGKLPAVLYGMETKTVFYYSNDGGLNWTPSTPIPINGMYDFPNAQSGFVWDGGKSLFGTLDGGLTWLQINQQITPGDNLVQIEFVNSQVGWALVDDGTGHTRLYQTSEAGYTWQVMP